MTKAIVLRLLESYFRHRWLYLAPIVIMTIVGAAYVLTRPREYLTESLVYVPGESYLATLTAVRSDSTSWWATPAQSAANKITELLRTDSFVRSLIAMTDMAADLGADPAVVGSLIATTRDAVWAVAQGDNQVLVGAAHESPVLAYQLAAATIENYTRWRIDAELAQSAVAQGFFADLIPVYAAEREVARQALVDYLRSHPEPLQGDRPTLEQLEVDRLRGDLADAEARLAATQDKDEEARLAASQAEVNIRQSFYVMDPPTIPREPATSLRQLALQIGGFGGVGLALTALAIVGGALLNRGFVFPVDVRENLHLPVLATVPLAPAAGGRAGRHLTGQRLTHAFVLSPPRAYAALPPGTIGQPVEDAAEDAE